MTSHGYKQNEISQELSISQISGVTTMGSDRENPGAPNPNGPNGGPQA
jgi:hypothetical protein